MADKVYLDNNGNPIQASAPARKVYLDDNGNPIQSGAPSSNPQEWMDSAGNVQTGVQQKPVDLGSAQTSISAQGTGVGAALNNAESKMESFVGGSPDDKVRDTMLSPQRGALHMAQGVVEGSPGRVVKGALEAATIPSMIAGPESAGAGKVGQGLEDLANITTKGGRAGMADAGVVKVMNGVAERAGLTKLTATTAREAVPELAGQFKQRASGVYQAVDKAVGGELQPVLDKIEDLRKAIKANQALDPEKAAQMGEQLVELGQQKGQLIQKAVHAGVADAEQAIKIADRDWFQYRSLERAGKQIKSAAGEVIDGGVLNVRKLATRVDQMINTGKDVAAMGKEGAQELKDTAKAALSKENLIRGTKKAAAYGGAFGGVGYGLFKLATGLTGNKD